MGEKKEEIKFLNITISIDEEVIKELETGLMVKAGCGNLYGTQDEFVVKVIDAIRKGWTKVTIKSIPPKKRR